jgi:hypothetical protein
MIQSMKILSIETSCDETAISLLEANGEKTNPEFNVLGDALYSQIEKHREFGGVYPSVAKREHALNLTPLLEKLLKETNEEIIPNDEIIGIEQNIQKEVPKTQMTLTGVVLFSFSAILQAKLLRQEPRSNRRDLCFLSP